MQEIIKPKNFDHNLNFKMSNMNMNIKIQTNNVNRSLPFSYWIDPKKLKKYTLPTFTKKNCFIFGKSIMKKNCNNWSGYFWLIYCKFV
jgi:hypothetical protein